LYQSRGGAGNGNERERERKGTTGSKEEKREQGKRRGTWEVIKKEVCVPYSANKLLATI